MKPCHVYLVGHEHATFGYAVKVGISDSIASRLSSLQTGSCEELKLFFSFKLPTRAAALRVEQRFHQYFDDWCIRGEWFGMPPNGALMLLSYFVVEVLRETTSVEALADVRHESGLRAAFDIIDYIPGDEQDRWNDEWHSHVVEASS
jgi:hypothetical protein